MVKIKVKIIDPAGMHARPAAIVSGVAAKFSSEIHLEIGNKKANLKSIMNIMALGIRSGEEITITAQGNDEKQALEEIKKSLQDNQLI